MNRRFLAFDIETAKQIPGREFDWRRHRPLGITCIGSLEMDSSEPRVWLSRGADGKPAPQMAARDVARFVEYLVEAQKAGYILLSWNGLAFDFDILAEECGLVDECRGLASSHVDMMFHVLCEKGFPVALKNAATGLGVSGKLAGVEGIDAPKLWATGKHDLVCEYVAQDVRTTLQIAQKAEHQGRFSWTTQRGTISSMPLRNGWLSVSAAARLPLPDTSWMSNPPARTDFTAWLND